MTHATHRTAAIGRVLSLAALGSALILGAAPPPAAGTDATITDPAATPDSGEVYVDDRVMVLELALADEALAALRAQPREYVPARVTIAIDEQQYGPFEVGARLKGSASFRDLDGKAAWRLKFGHVVKGQRLFGLKGFTLNNMVQDPSMIAEATTHRLFRESGAPAPRTGYAYLTVNGDEFGLYANVETIDTVFASRWFPTTGHILEGEYGADVTPTAAGRLEVDEGSEDDLSDLAALVEAAASDDAAWASATAQVADLGSMTRMWALEHLALHWDGYSVARGPRHPNNYYLHSDTSGVFSMIPSGADQTWSSPVPAGFGEVGAGTLFRRCIGVESCRASYVAALASVADREADLALAEHAREVASAIRPWVERDPRREASLSAVEASQTAKLAAMTRRFADLRAWLASPAFTWADPAPPPGGGAGGGSAAEEPTISTPPVESPSIVDPEPVGPEPVATATAETTPGAPATTGSRLTGLSGPALAAMAPRQFGSLSRTELARLTRTQAAFVTVAQWRRLRPAQIAVLPPAAVRAIPVTRLRALGPTWGSALRPTQVQALRPAQLRALGLR